MGRRFRRNCGLYFFCFRDMVPESKDGWGSIYSALHLRKARQRTWMGSRVIDKCCVNTDPGMGILSETWATCWGGCEGGRKEASETIQQGGQRSNKKYWKILIKQLSEERAESKIQDGTASTLGSLDSPHLRHPRIGKAAFFACQKFLEISFS